MNTLTLVKKQINKAAALHDAQIAMTTYRGVKFECKQGDADEAEAERMEEEVKNNENDEDEEDSEDTPVEQNDQPEPHS